MRGHPLCIRGLWSGKQEEMVGSSLELHVYHITVLIKTFSALQGPQDKPNFQLGLAFHSLGQLSLQALPL